LQLNDGGDRDGIYHRMLEMLSSNDVFGGGSLHADPDCCSGRGSRTGAHWVDAWAFLIGQPIKTVGGTFMCKTGSSKLLPSVNTASASFQPGSCTKKDWEGAEGIDGLRTAVGQGGVPRLILPIPFSFSFCSAWNIF
jgi:hypothetical protein